MGLLDLLFRKKNKDIDIEKILGIAPHEDYLLKAANASQQAAQAINEQRYDDAWGHYHQIKMFYMQHANHLGDPKFAIELDARVHEQLANVLRLEEKHRAALPHIIYWIVGGRRVPFKKHGEKFKAYFKRCDFKNTALADAEKQVSDKYLKADLLAAQELVASWIEKG